MTAVVLGVALSVALLCVLRQLFRRAGTRTSRKVPTESPSTSSIAVSPVATRPEIASLDDAAFREWLGVLPAIYDRYVDTGLEDLEIFLADHPVRRVGEDPA
jgi:hypothetical protein